MGETKKMGKKIKEIHWYYKIEVSQITAIDSKKI